MSAAALELYKEIMSISRIEAMIGDGETEGINLECKAPTVQRLTRDIKTQLARAVSGFSNCDGGVIIWGVATTKHSHSGLDVLSHIEPLGNCKHFEQQISRAIPSVSMPNIIKHQTTVIKKRSTDTQGLVVALVPKTSGDPVQSTVDNHFYFRVGDGSVIAPYELIKGLFAAIASPDLLPVFLSELVKENEDGSWVVPIGIQNASSATAEHVKISVIIENPQDCTLIKAPSFRDQSSMNPGKKIFMTEFDGVIHRGLNEFIGNLVVTMEKNRRSKRRLDITVVLYANKMVASQTSYCLKLEKKGFSAKVIEQQSLY